MIDELWAISKIAKLFSTVAQESKALARRHSQLRALQLYLLFNFICWQLVVHSSAERFGHSTLLFNLIGFIADFLDIASVLVPRGAKQLLIKNSGPRQRHARGAALISI